MIDFTYNSNRRYKVFSYGVRGGDGPIVDDEPDVYTDCFVAAVSSNGDMCGPFMFTAHYVFDPHRNHVGEAGKERKRAVGLMREYGISPAQAIYWGEMMPKTKKYVAESKEIVKYLIDNELLYGKVILRDAGNCFSEDGVDLLEAAGHTVYTMPPAIHANVSVLDNGVWNIAKKQLAASGVPRSDHIGHSLELMRLIAATDGDHIQYCFRKNLLTNVRRPSTEQCIAALRGDYHDLYSQHRQWLHEYKVDSGNTTPSNPTTISELQDTFDGPAMK